MHEELHRQQQHMLQVRARLRRPPNAVKDVPIDLKRTRDGPTAKDVILQRIPIPAASDIDWWTGRITPLMILDKVAEYFFAEKAREEITLIRGEAGTRTYYHARQVFVYLCYKHIPTVSCGTIGRVLHRDHTTIGYSKDKILRSLASGKAGVEEEIRGIEALIYGYDPSDIAVSTLAEQNVPPPEVETWHDWPADVSQPGVQSLDHGCDSKLVAAEIKALPPLDSGPIQCEFELLPPSSRAA